MKKIIAAILCVIMVLQVGHIEVVHAESAPTSKVSEDEFDINVEGVLIYEYSDLLEIANRVNNGDKEYASQTFLLVADIEIEDEWVPIGTTETPFTGVFNGNGKKIIGMEITSNKIYSGLFGVSNGIVQNLYLENYKVDNTTQYCGSIAGYNGGVIVNCQTVGTIIANNVNSEMCIGGIAGINNGEIGFSSTIADPNTDYQIKVVRNDSDGFLTQPNTYAGGVVGSNMGTIVSCYSTNSVNVVSDDSNSVHGGGIAAYNNGTIKETYSTGNVLGGNYYKSYVAGVVAKNDASGQIKSCFSVGQIGVSSGDIYSSHISGSVVAENKGLVSKCYRYKHQKVTVPTYAFWDCGDINRTGIEIDNVAKFHMLSFLSTEMSWESANWEERMGDYPVLIDVLNAITRYTVEKVYGSGSIILEYNSLKNLEPDINSYIEEEDRLVISLDEYYPVDISECTLTNRNQLALVPKSTGSYIAAVHCDGRDALANEVYFDKESTQPVEINIYDSDDLFNVEYELLVRSEEFQPPRVVLNSRHDDFRIIPNMFNSGDEFFVRAITADGETYSELKLGIRIVDLAEVKDIDGLFDFGDKAFGFVIPREIPVIGGREIHIVAEDMPMGYAKTDDRIQVYLGLSDLEEGKFPDFKEAIDGIEFGMKNSSMLGGAITADENKWDFKIKGYIDIPLDNNGKMHVNGITSKVVLAMSGEWEHGWQTYIVYVPIVVKVKVEAKANAELILEFDENLGFDFLGAVEINTPIFTPSVGVGYVKGLDVSVYGKFSQEFYIDMSNQGIRSKLVGDFGVSAQALIWSVEEPIITKELLVYDNITKQSTNRLLRSSIQNYLSDTANYAIDRSYLDEQSQKKVKEFENSYDEKVIQDSVYHGAAPNVVKMNDGKIFMIWTSDITERSDYNYTAVVYSVCDPLTGIWMEPQIVDDDGTADFNPVIETDGENVWIAWMNAKQKFDSACSMSDLAASTEITVASFDFQKEKFANIITVTDDEYYDNGVDVFVNNGVAYVSWIKNLKNDVLNLGGVNEIYYAQIDNPLEVIKVVDSSTPICQMQLGTLGEEVVLSYVKDGDGDPVTMDDRQLYVKHIKGNDEAILYGTGTISSIFYIKLNGINTLFYHDGSYVYCIDKTKQLVSEVMKLEGASSFEVLCGNDELAIIYIAPSQKEEGENSAYIIRHNGVGWNSPIVLKETDGYIKNISGYIGDDGNYRVYYSKTKVEFLETGLKRNTALCTNVIAPYSDISVDNIAYGTHAYTSDTTMNVEFDVFNKGFSDITFFDVEIVSEEGKVLFQQTLECEVKSGESEKISLDITLPSKIKNVKKYKIIVLPADSVDVFEQDNIVELTIGYSNIEVEAKRISSGNAVGVVISVTNKGYKKEHLLLYVHKNNMEGDILTKISLGTVRPGETAKYVLEPNRFRMFDEDITSYCFEVLGGEELLLGNNSSVIWYQCKQVCASTDIWVPYYYDVNADEIFDIKDFVRIKKKIEQKEEDLFTLDINGDCEVDAADIVNVRMKLINN